MKLVKNLSLALVLGSVLVISAPAGEINTPAAAATPTPPPPEAKVISDDGVVVYDPNPVSTETETSDYLFFEALAALLSMY
jgi:hypothetical protein